MKLKILIIIDGLSGGGAEKNIITISEEMINRGHIVSIFSFNDICDYKFFFKKKINFKIIKDYSFFPWRKFTELKRISKILDKEITLSEKKNGKFNLIISNLYKSDRIVSKSKFLSKRSIWFCVHSIFSKNYLKYFNSFFYFFKKRKIKNLYKNKNIIAVSKYVLFDLKKNLSIKTKKSIIISNPFNFSLIRKLSKYPCELSGLKYIIHVSRLHKNKRQDRLLKAYAKSKIKVPLIILGKGSKIILEKLIILSKKLKISHKIFFKGFKENPYPYIKNARMLVLSSDSEGFGNVLVESLICKTPVVSTKCPGGPQYILKDKLSNCLSKLNSNDLSKTMRKIYFHPPLINDSYINEYNVAVICNKYINLI